jgi:hypothetical protein
MLVIHQLVNKILAFYGTGKLQNSQLDHILRQLNQDNK